MNTTDVTGGAGTAYPSVEPDFTPGFSVGGSCCSMLHIDHSTNGRLIYDVTITQLLTGNKCGLEFYI
jgi:hypothetical protein